MRNSAFSVGVPKFSKKNDALVMRQLSCLGYIDDYDDSDSGSGAALSSIFSAAATIGSAAIIANSQPTAVAIPTRTNPAYGAAAPMPTGTILIVGVLGLFVIGAALVVYK